MPGSVNIYIEIKCLETLTKSENGKKQLKINEANRGNCIFQLSVENIHLDPKYFLFLSERTSKSHISQDFRFFVPGRLLYSEQLIFL